MAMQKITDEEKRIVREHIKRKWDDSRNVRIAKDGEVTVQIYYLRNPRKPLRIFAGYVQDIVKEASAEA